MAGEVKPIIFNWILDYFCFWAWEEFKRHRKLSDSLLDSLSGLLGPEWKGDSQRYDKKIFLIVLARIADGEDITMRYEEGSDLSPLEDLLPHFKKLVELQLQEDLVQEGLKIFEVIRFEAVCVHLRQNEFKLAQRCYSRVFTEKDIQNPQPLKKLRACITEKKNIGGFGYTNFVESIMEYLQKIVDQFDKPLLVQAATYHLESQKQAQSEKITRQAAEKSLVENMKNRNSSNSTNKSDENKEKLRKLWDKNVRDIFGSPSPVKTSTEMMPPPTPPPVTTGLQKSKVSVVLSKISGSPLPSTSKASPTLVRPPIKLHTPSPGKKRLFESPRPKASKSNADSVTNRTPTKDDSPELQYKKNKGRQNRHEPSSVLSSTRCIDVDTMSEVSSVTGGHRKRKWTEEEMVEFFNAVKTFGVGKWAEIRDDIGTVRTGVMLKDKWRTMLKSGDVDRLDALYNKKKQKKK